MDDIRSMLPHREPFLFIDRLERSDEEGITAVRTFTAAEPFFAGHFPEYPVVPGVVLVETMAQAGGAGIRQRGILGERLFFLASVEKARFRRQVRPNEECRIEVTNLRISDRMLRQSGRVYVGEELAAEAEWLCLVGDAPSE